MPPPKVNVQLEYRNGDLFAEAASGTVFIHSCNCAGFWGKGVALEFKKRYPKHATLYQNHCKGQKPQAILGQSMLLLPTDPEEFDDVRHYIGCLFVKERPGKPKSEQEKSEMLEATRSAMHKLFEALEAHLRTAPDAYITELRMPKINSGLFGIPWEQTLATLDDLSVPGAEKFACLRKIVVYTG